MIRSQRRRHLVTWLILGPALALAFFAAIAARPVPPVQQPSGAAPGATP